MRPDVLNPLFAETETLEGVAPKLQKPLAKLGLTRVRDVAYHLPERFVTRRPIDNLDQASVGEQVVVPLTVIEHRSSRTGRGPYNVLAQDALGNVARRDSDALLRRKAVGYLSQSQDPHAADVLQDILQGP